MSNSESSDKSECFEEENCEEKIKPTDNTPNIPTDPLDFDSSMPFIVDKGFSGVRYSRHDSETSIGGKNGSMNSDSYWTINDDNAEVDAASEADEESIASSLRDASKFTFLKQTNDKNRRSNRSESCSRSLVSTSTEEVNMDDTNLTYKVVTRKEKLTLEAPLPSFDKPILPALNDAKEQWTVDNFTRLLRQIVYHYQKLPFYRYRLFTLTILCGAALILPGFISGLLFGFYFSLIAFLFTCVSEPNPTPVVTAMQNNDPLIEDIKSLSLAENSISRVYKGWMNILNEEYNPHTFHVNNLQTVLVRLDGNMLRISRPERALLRHAFHDDPTLSRKEPRMISQSIYDLTNATVKLRPKKLAKRRWFTRRYPICIKLASVERELHSRNEDRYLMSQSKTMTNGFLETEEKSSGIFSKMFKKKRSHKNSENSSSESQIVSAEAPETTVNDSESPERITVGAVEMGREADGYASDIEQSDNEADIIGVHRSFSAENLQRGSLVRLQKNFPGPQSPASRKIYLFARSTREKERWFHKLRRACQKYGEIPKKQNGRKLSLPAKTPTTQDMTRDYFLYLLHHLQYSRHLDEILIDSVDQRTREEQGDEFGTIYMDLGRLKWQKPETTSSKDFVVLANLLASRIFYDFCRDPFWCEAVRTKIQTKIATLHLPYFIETLELSKFDIGTAIPKIKQVFTPTVDDWGTWVDFDVKYEGCIRLVLETRVNLMKLKSGPNAISEEGDEPPSTQLFSLRKSPSRYYDETIPESPETSPDEDFGSKMRLHETVPTKKKTGTKILHFVDKIAHSKYFKEASELKPIKKMMEEVSSTRLILNVEVTSLEGTCTINIPPPPSDRLWYGFRTPPQMSIKGIPQIGDRTVVFSTISDWIESKIRLILEKNIVVPNLDDIIIPVLSGNELLTGPLNL